MDLLERDLQLKALRAALNEARQEGRVAFVYGEAGIGKTALVEQFINENENAWRILRGACDSLFTPRPLGPLYDIALQTERDLSAFLESESNRGRLFSACLSELQTQQTVLVIEDIHWADEATFDLLKYLGRRIRQTKALMILTYRDDETSSDHPLRLLLGDLASTHALHRISVSSLSKEAVQRLAKNKNIDSVELHRLTNGNPFFITEVLAVERGIPETVRDAVLARAARLSPSARSVLEAAAVIGSRLEAWLLSDIVGEDAGYVEECVSRGLLQLQGDYYAFRHELARQTILESIPLQRKIAWHRKTLNALKETSVTRENMTRLAHHAEAINDPDAVLEFAPLAAWWASTTSSHRESVALYELALRFAKSLPPANHAQMLEAYMVELEFMNRFSDEIEACQHAIARWHSIGNRLREGKNLATLAGLYMNVGRRAEAEKSMERSIALLEELAPSAELAQAYTEQCYIKMMYRDCEEAIGWGEKAIKLAERFEDFDALARAHDYIGCAALIVDYDRGLKLLERSLVIAREKNLPFAVGGTLGNLGGMLLEVRQVTLANQYLEESINYATQQDNDYHLMESQAWQAVANMYQGKWLEADKTARKILQQSSNIPNVTRLSALSTLGRIGMRQGGDNIGHILDEAFEISIQADSPRFDSPRLLQAEQYWLIGNQHAVLEETQTAYEIAIRNKHPWIAGELAFWRWRSGEESPPPVWIATPFARQIAGDWHGAAKEWEEHGCPYEQAMALMDGDEAAQLAALEIFERLGAMPVIDILKRKMRADGIRIPRRPRPATRENPFNLTAREMEALICLADGLSNHAIAKKLSLSTRTAEHHIASILQKMGVGSRSEAVALALKEKLLRSE